MKELSPSMENRWRFRSVTGETFGLGDDAFSDVVRTADIFLNVSGGTLLRDEYMDCRRKVLIDTDPGWNHFRNYPRWDQKPGWNGSHGYRAHDFFFTYAEMIGQDVCRLPSLGLSWETTRPPVVMSCWASEPPNKKWTTVMTWRNFKETIEYEGRVYGTKELEFEKVSSIPAYVSAPMEIATGGASVPAAEWRAKGWSVIEAAAISATPDSYREYVQQSRGEFSVAKNVYTATRSGWFSCRSACYLASGLPVVVQDTGFSEIIPTGEGLLAFSNLEDAAEGIARVEREYEMHCDAARQVARDYFAADVVLSRMLETTGL
jgi:hypothetical protein